jgi:hypothetical protein
VLAAKALSSFLAHSALFLNTLKMDYRRIGGHDQFADCINVGVDTLAEAFDHVIDRVSSKSLAMIKLLSKMGPFLTVRHEVRVEIVLDHSNLLSSDFFDLLNEVLRDNIWRWNVAFREFFHKFCSRSSRNGKLQGPGVRFELLHSGVHLSLNRFCVVAKIV